MSLIFCGLSTTERLCAAGETAAAGGETVVVAVVFEFALSDPAHPANVNPPSANTRQESQILLRDFIFSSKDKFRNAE
jgi:hypothetical protein